MNVQLKIIRGEFAENKDYFKKMDPYVIIEAPQRRFKTKVAYSEGQTPSWNNVFYLRNVTTVRLSAHDDDLFRHDFLGEAILDVRSFVNQNYDQAWFRLFENNVYSGRILIEIHRQ